MRDRNRIEKITTVNGKQYKLQLLKDKTAKNLHHILGQCNFKHGYAVQNHMNKIVVNEIGHDNLNRFFGDRQTVHQQLLYLLKDWGWDRVLSDCVKETLYGLLSLPRSAFYKEELIREGYGDKELFSNEESRFLKDTI